MATIDERKEILEVAIIAARQAADLIRDAANASTRSAESLKGVNDIVTETDRRAEEVIRAVIESEFPDHNVLGEETHTGSITHAGTGYRWIVDPIDGTTNFAHRFPPYAVSIGVLFGSEYVAGVVLNVPSDELFTASSGDGACLNGSSIRVSRDRELRSSLVATGFPERSFRDVDRVLGIQRRVMQRCRGLRRPGAASVDLAYVACGRLDAFYEEGLQPWDVAAGLILVQEAGGLVTNYDGSPDVFGRQEIVATNGLVHDELLGCLESRFNV